MHVSQVAFHSCDAVRKRREVPGVKTSRNRGHSESHRRRGELRPSTGRHTASHPDLGLVQPCPAWHQVRWSRAPARRCRGIAEPRWGPLISNPPDRSAAPSSARRRRSRRLAWRRRLLQTCGLARSPQHREHGRRAAHANDAQRLEPEPLVQRGVGGVAGFRIGPAGAPGRPGAAYPPAAPSRGPRSEDGAQPRLSQVPRRSRRSEHIRRIPAGWRCRAGSPTRQRDSLCPGRAGRHAVLPAPLRRRHARGREPINRGCAVEPIRVAKPSFATR